MLSTTRSFALAALLTAPVLLAGCGSSDDGAGNGRQAVAAFYPLAWVTERVAGDDWEVTNLTQPGGEPHSLELGIAERASVEKADLLVFQRGFQAAVESAVDQADGAKVDAAEAVELVPAEDIHAGHEGEGHEEEGHDDHDHGDTDPHFWLDPLLMADLGDAVAGQLADVDSANAETYRTNAQALRTELEAVDTEYTEGLTSCERDVAVVSHAAFGYLERYGVHFEAIAGLSPDAEPTAADLARLHELVRSEGVTTVFTERLVSPKMAESLASDTGVRTEVLDPLEGLSDETSDKDYLSLMRDNLAALRTANGCS